MKEKKFPIRPCLANVNRSLRELSSITLYIPPIAPQADVNPKRID
jgi:hypothetical protein